MKQIHKNYIYIIDKNNKPLMPTERRKMVFRLLDENKAKVKRRNPFTIKLLFETTDLIQKLDVGVDLNLNTVNCFVKDSKENCYISSLIYLKNDVSIQ